MSIATTLPELIFGINAILMKHREMSIGDQIGTVFTNMTLILGLVVIIHPITTSFLPFLLSCIFLLISSIVIIYFIKNDQKLDIKEGIFLLIIYMLFISIEILL
jgi:cation:H+ antiporter